MMPLFIPGIQKGSKKRVGGINVLETEGQCPKYVVLYLDIWSGSWSALSAHMRIVVQCRAQSLEEYDVMNVRNHGIFGWCIVEYSLGSVFAIYEVSFSYC